MRTFYSGVGGKPTDLLNYATGLSLNTSTANLNLFASMINDEHKKLLQEYFFNEKTFTTTTVAGQQFYPLPYNYSKLKDGTITIGNLRWTPSEVLSRADWDKLNTINSYKSDIPNNYYIWNNQFGLWPIPATTGNILSFNYQTRVPDLTFTDYVTGTVSATNTGGVTSSTNLFGGSTSYTTSIGVATTGGNGTGCTVNTTCVSGVVTAITINAAGNSYQIGDLLTITGGDGTATFTVNGISQSSTITGSGTTWSSVMNGGNTGSVMFMNLWLRITSPQGDGNWYQISSIQSDTSLTLVNPYQGQTTSGASYTIGQMPLLLEDFQDACVFEPLIYYYSTIKPNAEQANMFIAKQQKIIAKMDKYVGTKSLNVNLGRPRVGENPNLYSQNFG